MHQIGAEIKESLQIIWFCRIFRLNLRQNSEIMSSESIESKILSRIRKCGRGNLLFALGIVRDGETISAY